MRGRGPDACWWATDDGVLDCAVVEAAFFDLDKTVIAKASMAAFGRPFYRGGLISRRTVRAGARLAVRVPPSRCQRAEAGQDPRAVLRMTGDGTRPRWLASCARPSTRWSSPSSTPRRSSSSSSTTAGTPDLHRLCLTGGDRRPLGGVPRGRRVHRQPGGGGPRRPVHRGDGLLRLRTVQGRGHPRPGRRPRASTSPPRTPTATPIPTCPCSRWWAIPWPSTRTGCSAGWPASGNGRSASSPRPVRLRDRVPVPNLPTAAAIGGVALAATGAAFLAWRLGRQRAAG